MGQKTEQLMSKISHNLTQKQGNKKKSKSSSKAKPKKDLQTSGHQTPKAKTPEAKKPAKDPNSSMSKKRVAKRLEKAK